MDKFSFVQDLIYCNIARNVCCGGLSPSSPTHGNLQQVFVHGENFVLKTEQVGSIPTNRSSLILRILVQKLKYNKEACSNLNILRVFAEENSFRFLITNLN